MSLDTGICDQLTVSQLTHHTRSLTVVEMANLNLSQGLGVIHNSLIHANGATSDDPGLIAALQTASGAPRQGSLAKSDQ